MHKTDVLVIGAGPYGLCIAAYAKAKGLDVAIVGEPMAFWKNRMPAGMLLRSGRDWHLDASDVHTLEAFLEERRIPRGTAEPIPVELFRDYSEWFRQSKKIEVQPVRVSRIREADGEFEVVCDNEHVIRACRVVAAPGLAYFASIPPEISSGLAGDQVSHTASLVDFRPLAGKRCLIVGGRQSAFEWTALMMEAGIGSVDLVFRHETPAFVHSDWSFTDAMIENTLRVRGWFRRLEAAEQKAVHQNFWRVGRLQLEPWLAGRIHRKNVRIRQNSRIASLRGTASGEVEAHLDGGDAVLADHVICATGYRVDVSRVPYLVGQVASGRMRVTDGFPVLDEDFQTTAPGLYIVGQASMQLFGPFFGFLRGCTATARIVAGALQTSAV